MKRSQQTLSLILKIALAAGLIIWLVKRGTLDFSLLTKLAHPTYLLPCMVALFLNIFINNYRWVYLLKGQGFSLGVKDTLPLSFIGLFFNYAMPGGVGGDIVKGYYVLQDHPTRKTAAAISIVMDRIVGFVGMVIVSLIAIFLNFSFILSRGELTSLAAGVGVLSIVFMLFFGFAFSSRIYKHPIVSKLFRKLPGGDKLKKIYDSVHSYRASRNEFLIAFALTLLTQIAAIGFFWLAGNALGIADVPLLAYMFVVPLGLIATALPISPAGIGVGQAVFLVLFNWTLGFESQLGPSLITAHQLMTFVLGLVGAFFYFKKKKPNFSGTNGEVAT